MSQRSRHDSSRRSSIVDDSSMRSLLNVCRNCNKQSGCDCEEDTNDSPESCNRRYPEISRFSSIITPLTNLTPLYSGCTGTVEFLMRRKNKTVTLQWEPFTATMAASGVTSLIVVQSICNTPPYPVTSPIYLEYKSVGRITRIEIDPHSNNGNIRFYLNTDSSATNITAGDAIKVNGGAVTWIVE
jgi:hypothetical protein